LTTPVAHPARGTTEIPEPPPVPNRRSQPPFPTAAGRVRPALRQQPRPRGPLRRARSRPRGPPPPRPNRYRRGPIRTTAAQRRARRRRAPPLHAPRLGRAPSLAARPARRTRCGLRHRCRGVRGRSHWFLAVATAVNGRTLEPQVYTSYVERLTDAMALVEALRARGAGGGGFVAIEAEARATAGVHPLEWCLRPPRPPPPLRTNRTRRVLHPVLIGHAVSLTLYNLRLLRRSSVCNFDLRLLPAHLFYLRTLARRLRGAGRAGTSSSRSSAARATRCS
jgi:hypothetical protein